MTNRIINCKATNCGGDGFRIGDGVQAELIGNTSVNNGGHGFNLGDGASSVLHGNTAENNGGDGFRFAGSMPQVISNNRASGNAGNGFNFEARKREIIEQLDLPAGIDRTSIDPIELGKLLAVLGITAQDRKVEVVKSSSLLEKIKGTFDVTGFISSLLTISADTRVQNLINQLLA